MIGKNDQWKQRINLGRQNNQSFVNIPHARFIEILTYKAELVGINVLIQEESYTSKASVLDGDMIPVYGTKEAEDATFSGKRIKRGLYIAKDGRLINADVNASYNVIRKAIPNAFADGIESCVVQPRRITPLKVKTKGGAEMLPKAA